jgi:hypothetical protein
MDIPNIAGAITYDEATRSGWVRREHVTRGPDPTVVVKWYHQPTDVSVTEFQMVYRTEVKGKIVPSDSPMAEFGESVHRKLEVAYYTWLSESHDDEYPFSRYYR